MSVAHRPCIGYIEKMITQTFSAVLNTSLPMGEKTLELAHLHGVDPTPQNYAVWYEYATGLNPALTREIERIIQQKLPFTAEVNRFLHDQFIREQEKGKLLDAAATNTRHLLGEVHKLVKEFSGETTSYSNVLDKQVGEISAQLTGIPEAQTILREIAESAGELRKHSSGLHQKLEASHKEIENLRESLTKVTTESNRDHLTGVANRKAFDAHIKEMTNLALEEKTEVSLLLIDIDHFKQFNDQYGHMIGDEVLKIVAKALTDSVRGKDIVARYGGEEFAVILPATPLKGGLIVAEAIRKAIASRDLKRRDTGQSYGSITVSVGVGQYHGLQDSIDLLIKRADEALYASKHAGRNRITGESG